MILNTFSILEYRSILTVALKNMYYLFLKINFNTRGNMQHSTSLQITKPEHLRNDPKFIESPMSMHLSDLGSDSEFFDEEQPSLAKESEFQRIIPPTYIFRFKFGVFIKYFFIHLIYLVFGPFIAILSPIFGYKLLRNLRFFGWSDYFFIQNVNWVFIIAIFLINSISNL
jgi:hypothetical protein